MNEQEQALALELLAQVNETVAAFAEAHGLAGATLVGQFSENTFSIFRRIGFVPTDPIEIVPVVKMKPPPQGNSEPPKESPPSRTPDDGANKNEPLPTPPIEQPPKTMLFGQAETNND